MIVASGGIRCWSGVTAQTFTTSFAKATPWSSGAALSPATAAGSAWAANSEGDLWVQPDPTNDRILVFTPGVYLVQGELAVSAGGASDVVAALYAAGAQVLDATTEFTVAASGKVNGSFQSILSLTRTQAISNTANAKLELYLKALGGSTSIPIEYASMIAMRLE
jgi:hypothetical protein